jgi:hypothetical protein
MSDFIPRSDANFDTWLVQFNTAFASIAASLGFAPADAATINSAKTSWQTDYTTHITAQNNARAARATKDNRRENVTDMIRLYVRQIQSNPNTTDAQRAQLGITIPSDTRTRPEVPGISPKIELNWSERGQIKLFVGGTTGTQGFGFPESAMFVELQFRLPNGEWQLAGVTTKRTFIHHLDNPEPVTVEYRARYLNSQSEAGPWSETDIAQVAPVQVSLMMAQSA